MIQALAADIGLTRDAFGGVFHALRGEATDAHIRDSRALLARVGGHGFPTFALERDGAFVRVDIGPYLGQPQAWRAWLSQQLGSVTADAPGDGVPACSPDGCVLRPTACTARSRPVSAPVATR
ncbi:hypothetical protein [Piscinibacter sp.]|uniref:hypothetical protein n=1 Tax=Piscinibacter sp. TaxID=1903157 RepID=UPI002B9035B4|nr:hypothetical protein [Albitalea sp.]HUG25411.1 hypothetical protein [Albitalea sp.]